VSCDCWKPPRWLPCLTLPFEWRRLSSIFKRSFARITQGNSSSNSTTNVVYHFIMFKTQLRKFVKTKAFWIEFGFLLLGHVVLMLKLALQTKAGIWATFLIFHFMVLLTITALLLGNLNLYCFLNKSQALFYHHFKKYLGISKIHDENLNNKNQA
jgi:hypothetical protein